MFSLFYSKFVTSRRAKPFIRKCDVPTRLFQCKSSLFSHVRFCPKALIQRYMQSRPISERFIWSPSNNSLQKFVDYLCRHSRNDASISTASPSGEYKSQNVERWWCNPEVLGSRPPPCYWWHLFLASPEFLTFTFIWNICFLCFSGMPVN